MDLRPVADDELAALAVFINAAYRGESARQGWTHEADLLGGQRVSEEMLREDLAAHPGAQLLAGRDDAGQLVCCVWLEPAADGVWKLGMLTVAPELQGGGLGRLLLAKAEGWAARRGARRIALTVIGVRSALIAWYERRGYRLTGETQPFPYGDLRFGEPTREDLAFVVMEKPVSSGEAG